MLLLFLRQALEYLAASRVGRERGRSRVELEAAPLGRDRDAERVPREHELGRRAVHGRAANARATFLAGAKNLDDRLRRIEAASAGDLLDQRLDVRAQEL